MKGLKVLRIDDIPLLYEQVKELGIQEAIDDNIKVHGNRTGLSLGHLVSIWLCYLLSESDHRLGLVESWAKTNLELLKLLSGEEDMNEKDFTDDRLEQALDYLNEGNNWALVSNKLNSNSLAVYDIDGSNTVRLDAAPMQGHHEIKASGLFQRGYSKHHDSRLGMLKIMLACVDNEVNGFAYPLAHITVPGHRADDGLYISIMEECEKTFNFGGQAGRKLYVGDSKMGSTENRCFVVNSKNDYLTPLSKIQLSEEERNKEIEQMDKGVYKEVYKEEKTGEKTLIAEGFEREVKVSCRDENNEVHEWTERQIFVLSTSYATGQKKILDGKLSNAQKELEDLLVVKQGRKKIKTREELEQRVEQILNRGGLAELIDVKIEEQVHEREVRKYKDRPAGVEQFSTFEMEVTKNEEKIEARKQTLGWQVYATTLSEEELSFEQCVWKYRYQNRVERRFDDLRNKVVPLVPIFVRKDNRVEALINLLMVCLKICCVIEYKVSKQLQLQQEELANIYEGNPKRSTAKPTAKRLLKAFKGISLVLSGNGIQAGQYIGITDLSSVQLKIIQLLGFDTTIYTELAQRMQMFFSKGKISET